MSQRVQLGQGVIPLRLLVEESGFEGSNAYFTAKYGEKVQLIAPKQLALANIDSPQLAQALLFAQWAINDADWATPEIVSEYIALLKMTKSIKGKLLNAVLQRLRGEPVLVPVAVTATGGEGGGLGEKIKRVFSR